jgi:UDP-glucose 4-epimerase
MTSFKGSRVLVVGGAGFVGTNLVRQLHAAGASAITVVDNLLSSERTAVPDLPGIRFVEASITEPAVLAEIHDDLDYVFHLATYHGNQSSMHDPLADHANNAYPNLVLFNHCKGFHKLRKLVYASAGCTVAEKTFEETAATQEDAPVSLYLDSPYQISKIIGELYGNYFFMHDKLPIVKARFQNVYGPGEILGAGKWRGTPATVWRNVTPTFVYRAIKQLPLVVENEGVATRDFIFVDDIARGLMRCALAGDAGGVYNLASGVETRIGELATMINALTGNPTPIEWGPKRPWDRSGRRHGATDKARIDIGFTAETTLADGLRRTVEWTRANLALIDACVHQHAHHMN